MEKCGELPAAEPEIEPRCPGLVLKLPGLSRRAMRSIAGGSSSKKPSHGGQGGSPQLTAGF